MSVITNGNFPKLLKPGLDALFGIKYEEYAKGAQWKELFEMNNSNYQYEEDVNITGFGLAPRKNEGDSLAYDQMTQSYIAKYINIAYALGFIVTREQIRDNQYMKIGQTGTKLLAFSMHQTKENVAAAVFNNGFTSNPSVGDGQAIFSTAHPTLGGNLSNTQTVPADLSEKSIEEAVTQIYDFRDNRGNRIRVMPRKLAVPNTLVWEATRILKNPNRPATADRDINALYSVNAIPEGICVNQYFTDQDAYFILTNCPEGFKYFERDPLVFEDDNDFDTKNGKYSAYERYVFGVTDWRAGWGSPGA